MLTKRSGESGDELVSPQNRRTKTVLSLDRNNVWCRFYLFALLDTGNGCRPLSTGVGPESLNASSSVRFVTRLCVLRGP